MGTIKITIPWDCVVSKNRKYTVTRGRMILSGQYRKAKKDIAKLAAAQYSGDLIEEDTEVEVEIQCYEPDLRRRDHWNLLQAIGDGLEGVVYEDDYQVKRATTERTGLDRDNPRVEVTIREV